MNTLGKLAASGYIISIVGGCGSSKYDHGFQENIVSDCQSISAIAISGAHILHDAELYSIALRPDGEWSSRYASVRVWTIVEPNDLACTDYRIERTDDGEIEWGKPEHVFSYVISDGDSEHPCNNLWQAVTCLPSYHQLEDVPMNGLRQAPPNSACRVYCTGIPPRFKAMLHDPLGTIATQQLERLLQLREISYIVYSYNTNSLVPFNSDDARRFLTDRLPPEYETVDDLGEMVSTYSASIAAFGYSEKIDLLVSLHDYFSMAIGDANFSPSGVWDQVHRVGPTE
ncbi:MAG: hypothetical protein ACTS3F_02460 [Phycisphaerales bacterium]